QGGVGRGPAAAAQRVGQRGGVHRQRLAVQCGGSLGVAAFARGVGRPACLSVGRWRAAGQPRGQTQSLAAAVAACRNPASRAGRPRQRGFPATAGSPALLDALTRAFSAAEQLETKQISYAKAKTIGESTASRTL